jgi:hypothetical protein
VRCSAVVWARCLIRIVRQIRTRLYWPRMWPRHVTGVEIISHSSSQSECPGQILKDGWGFNSVLKIYAINVWRNHHTNKSKVLHVLQCLIACDFLDFYSIKNKIPYLIILHFWPAHLQLLLRTVSSSLTNKTVFSLERKLPYDVLWNNHYGCTEPLSWLAFVV